MNNKFLQMNGVIGIAAILTFAFDCRLSHAQTTQINDEFAYPELSVVPRASDRLQTEANEEKMHSITSFLPLQIPALTTLTSGIACLVNPINPTIGYIGLATGAAWLFTSTALSLFYHPYQSGTNRIQSLPKGTIRDQITRERTAEQEIQSAARFGEQLKWMSVMTQVAASVWQVTQVSQNSNSGSQGSPSQGTTITQSSTNLAIGMSIGSAVLALTPLIFRLHSYYVQDEQTEYRKRIYAPVAGAGLFQNPVTHTYDPGLMVSLRF